MESWNEDLVASAEQLQLYIIIKPDDVYITSVDHMILIWNDNPNMTYFPDYKSLAEEENMEEVLQSINVDFDDSINRETFEDFQNKLPDIFNGNRIAINSILKANTNGGIKLSDLINKINPEFTKRKTKEQLKDIGFSSRGTTSGRYLKGVIDKYEAIKRGTLNKVIDVSNFKSDGTGSRIVPVPTRAGLTKKYIPKMPIISDNIKGFNTALYLIPGLVDDFPNEITEMKALFGDTTRIIKREKEKESDKLIKVTSLYPVEHKVIMPYYKRAEKETEKKLERVSDVMEEQKMPEIIIPPKQKSTATYMKRPPAGKNIKVSNEDFFNYNLNLYKEDLLTKEKIITLINNRVRNNTMTQEQAQKYIKILDGQEKIKETDEEIEEIKEEIEEEIEELEKIGEEIEELEKELEEKLEIKEEIEEIEENTEIILPPIILPRPKTPIKTPTSKTPIKTPIKTPTSKTPIKTPTSKTPKTSIKTPTSKTSIKTPTPKTSIILPTSKTSIKTPIKTPKTPIKTPIKTPTPKTPIKTPNILPTPKTPSKLPNLGPAPWLKK